jgi:hypothetical protein
MIRLLATASLAVLALAACTPEAATPDPATVHAEGEGAVQPAMAGDMPGDFQLSYKQESENYNVTSEIDPAILAFDPVLANQLWKDAKQALDELGQQADSDKAEADKMAAETGDPSWFMGYTLDFTYKAGAMLDDVIGVTETVATFTGGAHPNYFLGGFNYRKGKTEPLPLSAFVADEPAFHELVVKALVAEKLQRGYEVAETASIESGLREILVPSPEVPDVYAGRFVLEKSTEAGKAGGISVLFSPYDVGSYAEGAYTVTLTAAELTPVLNETWAGRFGGEPVVEEEEPVREEQ